MIDEIKRENKIEYDPCQVLVYVVDGGGMDLPVVQEVKKHDEPHWLPVVLIRSAEPKDINKITRAKKYKKE